MEDDARRNRDCLRAELVNSEATHTKAEEQGVLVRKHLQGSFVLTGAGTGVSSSSVTEDFQSHYQFAKTNFMALTHR